jgi:hypothetical protein
MVPFSWNGSLFLYRRFIRPVILRHEKEIDSAIDVASDIAHKAADEVKGQAQAAIKKGMEAKLE